MRLELHKVHITGLAFADTTHVSSGTLYVNKSEAEELIAEDRRFAKVVEKHLISATETSSTSVFGMRILPIGKKH